MPIQRCQTKGRKGFRFGKSGRCHPGKSGRARAARQARAIRASGYTANARRPNPLRVDPTRSATLRRQFLAEVTRRFARLRRKVVELVDDEDAFGLKRQPGFLTGNQRQRWQFLTDPQKVREFEQWLATQVEADINSADAREAYQRYVEEGYRKGAGRAFDDTRRSDRVRAAGREQMGFVAGTRDEFLRSSFARPVAVEKVQLLAGRVFTDLKGVTSAMSTAMTRTLTDGLVRGQSPREIARALAKNVDGIGRNRARTIARGEIIRSHSEGQLTALEQLGVDRVGVMVEWTATANACPKCSPLNHVVLKISEARGMIPRHANCKCAWIPANVGERSKGQIRTKKSIDRAVDKSLLAETGLTSPRGRRAASRWLGADADIDVARPDGLRVTTLVEKAKKSAVVLAKIANFWPAFASEVVAEAGASATVAKIAMGAALAVDLVVPVVPVGSLAVIALASAKSPLAAYRVARRFVTKALARLRGGAVATVNAAEGPMTDDELARVLRRKIDDGPTPAQKRRTRELAARALRHDGEEKQEQWLIAYLAAVDATASHEEAMELADAYLADLAGGEK